MSREAMPLLRGSEAGCAVAVFQPGNAERTHCQKKEANHDDGGDGGDDDDDDDHDDEEEEEEEEGESCYM